MITFLKKLFLQKNNNSIVQFFRYGIVSGAALIVDFSGLVLLKEFFGLNYLISATLSFIGGLIVNYLLSLVWVFEKSKYSRLKEFSIFSGIGIVGLGINDITIWALTSQFGVFYVLSKLVATIFTFLWNFGVRKFLLFK